MNESLRSMRSRIGAHAKWARETDRTAATEPARQASASALEGRLIEQYSLDPGAPDFGERLHHARKAHFAALALKSAQARQRKKSRNGK